MSKGKIVVMQSLEDSLLYDAANCDFSIRFTLERSKAKTKALEEKITSIRRDRQKYLNYKPERATFFVNYTKVQQ